MREHVAAFGQKSTLLQWRREFTGFDRNCHGNDIVSDPVQDRHCPVRQAADHQPGSDQQHKAQGDFGNRKRVQASLTT